MMRAPGRKTRSKRQTLFETQGGLCFYCGMPMVAEGSQYHPLLATFEHLTPKIEGGKDARSNLVLAHRCCNQLRSRQSIESFVEKLFA
jgi:5-methylcytosine-specific restriction endonuclease McrA